MALTVESLNVAITSDSTTAVSALDSLIAKLEELNRVNLSNITASINVLAETKSVNTGELVELSKALEKVGKVVDAYNFSSLINISSSLAAMASAMPTTYEGAPAMAQLGASLSTLTKIDPTKFFVLGEGMKLLALSMRSVEFDPQLLSQLQEIATVIASIASKTGKRYGSDFTALADGLERLFQVLARAPTVSENTIRALETLGTLDAETVKAARGFANLSDGTARSSAGMKSYSENARHSVVATHSLTTRLAFAIGKFRQIYFVIRRIASFFAKMVDSAMDYVETLNYFTAAFDQVASRSGEIFGQAGQEAGAAFTNKFAEEALKLTEKMSGYAVSASGMVTNTMGTSLGMNPAMMMNYQATFAQMASSMGVSSEVATDLSRALTEIGADLASVKNLDFEDTWKNLQSGLVGMSRAVDKYGLNIRNVNLQQKLTQLGIEGNIQEMNQQDKALLRTIIILENSQYAWGDLADTLQQPANQIRMLRSGIANLGRTIGNLFLPIVAAALPYINAFVVALQKMFEMLVNLMGIDFDWGSVGGAAINSEWADYLDDTTESLGEATKAAEEWKNQILGFDEINKLGSESSDSGSGSSAGSNPYVSLQLENALRLALERYQKVWDESYASVNNRVNDIALKIIEWFGNIKTAVEPTTTALKSLWNEVFVPLGNWKWEVLKDFYNDFLKPVGQWVIGEGIPKLVELFIKFYNDIDWAALRNALDNLWKALAPFAKGTFEGIIKFFQAIEPLATLALDGVVYAFEDIANALNKIDPDTLKTLGEIFGVLFVGGAVGKGLGLFKLFSFLGGGGGTAAAGTTFFGSIFSTIKTGLTSALFTGLGIAIGDATSDLISKSGADKNNGEGRSGWALFGEWAGKLGTATAAGAGGGTLGGLKFGIPAIGALVGGYLGLVNELLNGRDSRGKRLADYTSPYLRWLKPIIFPEDYLFKPVDQGVEKVGQRIEETTTGAHGGRGFAARFGNGWNKLKEISVREVDIWGNKVSEQVGNQSLKYGSAMDISLKPMKTNVVKGFSEMYKTLKGIITGQTPLLTGALGTQGQQTAAKAQAVSTDTKKAYLAGLSGLTSDVEKVFTAAKGAIEKSKAGTKEAGQAAGEEIRNAIGDAISPVVTDTETSMSSLKKKITEGLSYDNVKKGLSNVPNAFSDVFADAANAAIEKYNEMAKNLSKATINNTKAFNVTEAAKVTRGRNMVTAYANGGYPEDGLFFANSTELVGRFSNGRTAVANNEQIIAGIEGGVARGMAQAIMSTANATGGTNGQPVQVVITVDSETLYRATLRGESKYNNRYHMTVR